MITCVCHQNLPFSKVVTLNFVSSMGRSYLGLLKEELAKDGIKVRGVYERSDANERTKEGLPKVKGFIGEEFDTNVEIKENGVRYLVDVVNGQKTGFFLDQKYNRLAMQRICKGKKVLDCFTHMGTFALNAGIAGAADVTGLDISEYAVQQANENARRNGLEDTVHFRCANVLDELPKLAQSGEQYDVVILDPRHLPSRARQRKTRSKVTVRST